VELGSQGSTNLPPSAAALASWRQAARRQRVARGHRASWRSSRRASRVPAGSSPARWGFGV